MKSGSFSEGQRKLFTEKMVLYGLSNEASTRAVIDIYVAHVYGSL